MTGATFVEVERSGTSVLDYINPENAVPCHDPEGHYFFFTILGLFSRCWMFPTIILVRSRNSKQLGAEIVTSFVAPAILINPSQF